VWIHPEENMWKHLEENEDRLTLERECGPTLKSEWRMQRPGIMTEGRRQDSRTYGVLLPRWELRQAIATYRIERSLL
jgi:hypothetical protein